MQKGRDPSHIYLFILVNTNSFAQIKSNSQRPVFIFYLLPIGKADECKVFETFLDFWKNLSFEMVLS